MLTKIATTQVEIQELLAQRWSPRALENDKPVRHEHVLALLEAARWAPSCFGAEPWRYIVCERQQNEVAWQQALNCLADANQVWAKNAPVLLLSVALNQFTLNGNPNRWAQYDTGAATENLCLQAVGLGLVAHQMGGFDPEKAKAAFSLPDNVTAMAMVAVGYQASPDSLDGELQQREIAERTRLPLTELCFDGQWQVPIKTA